MAGAEDEELEPLRARDERVLELVRALDDAVAGAYLVHLVVLPEQARTSQHEVDLLGRAVRMGRGGQLSRRDADAVHTYALRARRGAEHLPRRVHRPLGATVLLDVVPVRDSHAGKSNAIGRVALGVLAR